jgi:hypothetical protein
MGGCCCGSDEVAKDEIFVRDERDEKDLTKGPVKERGCTDVYCVIVFIAFWVGLIIVTFAGAKDGNPKKLIAPRDSRGAYCSVETQWNGGPNLKDAPKLMYLMNVNEAVDTVAKTFLCSSAVARFLESDSGFDSNAYDCACCNVPCSTCTGSLKVQDYDTPSSTATAVQSMLADLTKPSATGLFKSTGPNGDMFTNAFAQADKYFVRSCASSCDVGDMALDRVHKYKPGPANSLLPAWIRLANGSDTPTELKDTISKHFTFDALSMADCPYKETSRCVPFPGVSFTPFAAGICRFKVSPEAEKALGVVASSAIIGGGLSKLADTSTSELGDWVGELENSWESLIVTGFVAFVAGILFCVLLRFFLCCCVYTAIFGVFLLMIIGAIMLFVRSGQCQGASLFDSGKQSANAIANTALSASSGQLNLAEESLTGKGDTYVGFQTRTKSGLLCNAWDDRSPGNHSYTTTNFTILKDNFCRNPADAPTIWCFTSDPIVEWETCIPLGVIQPECAQGYEVENETERKALKICSYVVFAVAFVYLLLIVCLRTRINLAISLNEVAAQFIVDTPFALIVPIIFGAIGIAWVALWVVSATFLISQVPDDTTPKVAYKTYAEAYGTSDTAGKCTDKWPSGVVYEDLDNCDGDKCWRCYPPRFAIDWRIAFSFFNFLWNTAFIIACEECVVAGAVGAWFFAVRSEKRSARKVGAAVWNVVRYHSGSLLVGSFILAVVQFIRYTLMYFEQQAKAQKNRFAVILLKILQYVTWCVEKCIEFLNKNAYIQVALMGTNFCTSAKKAFYVIARNMVRFAVVASLGWIVQFLGYAFITISTVTGGYFIMKGLNPDANPVVPLIVMGTIGYVVGRIFMALFQLAVDTSLQAFLAVEEMGGEPQDDDKKFVPGALLSVLPEKK